MQKVGLDMKAVTGTWLVVTTLLAVSVQVWTLMDSIIAELPGAQAWANTDIIGLNPASGRRWIVCECWLEVGDIMCSEIDCWI